MRNTFRHSILTLLSITLFFAFATSSCNRNDAPEIIIIHTNDTHSQIDPQYIDGHQFGGAVERAAILEKFRNDNPDLLYLDAGDMIQGSPYFNIWNGEIEMKAMNHLGLIASTFGNHEFDNGINGLAQMLSEARFPLLSCNYDVSGTILEEYVKKSIILENKGVKIGITGVTVDPRNLIFNRNWDGITYTDPAEAANEEAHRLKDAGCDLVVLLSHVGYYADSEHGDRYIAANSTDIDLIIGGHTHTNLETGETVMNANGHPVVITQTGAKTSPIGHISIRMKKAGKHADKTPAYIVDTICCKKLHPDDYDLNGLGNEMTDLIKPYKDQLEKKMGEVLGYLPKDMPRFRPQSPLGNFASDIIRKEGSKHYGKPIDIGIVNIGGIRNDLYAGDLKLGDIFRIFPFENTLTIVELKGSDIIEAIHQMENRKGLDAISGMQFTVQITDNVTHVKGMTIGGRPVNPDKVYSIATIDYLAEGNDGLTAFTRALSSLNTGILLRDIMISYVKAETAEGRQICSDIDDRVIILP